MPHTTHVPVDADRPASQETNPSGSHWQLPEGALDANQYQYQHQQTHDTIPTSRSAWEQTTDRAETGPDTCVDESLSSDQRHV